MQKIILILWLFIFITGCSVIKKTNITDNKPTERSQVSNILEGIENQNLTNRNFFIQKAEIEIISEEENQKLIASIKFIYPDKYLISLKSKTGIEAARIFITHDTVLINDRINRNLYFGKPEQLKNKYGISPAVLPVVLGDFIKGSGKLDKEIICIDGKADLDCIVAGMKINYTIDCNLMKIILARQEASLKNSYAEIEYRSFIKGGGGLIPAKIRLSSGKTVIDIKPGKVISPWDGSIDFIPGSRYDLIELL